MRSSWISDRGLPRGHSGSYLLVFASLEMEANDGPLVITRKVEGRSRLLVDNEVDVSGVWHFDTECEDRVDTGGWMGFI